MSERDTRAAQTALTNARLVVNDWHSCATPEELNRWRQAQLALIDAARAYERALLAEAERPAVEQDEARAALERLVAVIDMAGLLNLSNGVQLGATSWYVKASDARDWALRALKTDPPASPAPAAVEEKCGRCRKPRGAHVRGPRGLECYSGEDLCWLPAPAAVEGTRLPHACPCEECRAWRRKAGL